MSLRVHQLVRVFGKQKAVDNISFSLEKGEIVGFLGPNGAGKSTTMKIACGFLAATSGSVHVQGFDVSTQAMQVKRIIGYLPENNPLYKDMYVREYLGYIGGLYGLGKNLRMRVDEMISVCRLTDERNKRIEQLSKGYRQRVGLAQALIHDPEVLILDEPTSGLDPNQLGELRMLIKDISQNKTVLFSTHIMQEVRAMCDRVVVIAKGKIVKDDLLKNVLAGQSERTFLFAEFGAGIRIEDLLPFDTAGKVEQLSPTQFRITGQENIDLRPAFFRYCAEKNLPLLELRQEGSSLEDIFRTLTQPEIS